MTEREAWLYPYRWQGKAARIDRLTCEGGVVLEFMDGSAEVVPIEELAKENKREG